jgi:hypothetical protein
MNNTGTWRRRRARQGLGITTTSNAGPFGAPGPIGGGSTWSKRAFTIAS